MPTHPPVATVDAAPDDERRRAVLVAIAVAGEAARRGRSLSPDLRIWRLAAMPAPVGAAGADGPPRPSSTGECPDEDDPAGVLGAALEAATDGGLRRAQGLHVTPRWLADDLVARALPDAAAGDGPARPDGPTVCDPACGGGAFLVAGARRLHAGGLDRRAVVRHHVWGADIDPVGLAAAEAALALWAGEAPPPGRLVVGDPLRDGIDVWPTPPAGFDAVIGNPPFQSQLGRATARDDVTRAALRARYGDAVRAYTDTAWLFLLLGSELARPGGRAVLVQPQSVVAARDAGPVRATISTRAHLHELWVDDGRVFSAAVRVCAPVLVRRSETADDTDDADDADHDGGPEPWARAWARAATLPPVDLRLPGTETLGERAAVWAGFRDQYYGLAEVTVERDDLPPGAPVAPLVTSGLVDWAACGWGTRQVRYARRRWEAPVVDLDRLSGAPPVAQRWVARCRAPKLVVASQTRVVEAAVDPAGGWVPSVPALAVVPHDPDDLWLLAAAVLAPAASAWLAHRSGGTALDGRAIRVAKPDLVELPLPGDPTAWDAAARALADYRARPGPAAVDRYLAAAEAAYGAGPDVTRWWRARAGTAVRGAGPGH